MDTVPAFPEAAVSICAEPRYLPPGLPIIVPKRDGSHWTFCTHDKELFADFLANGFCNMERHSPRDLFSSRLVYDCPNLGATDLSFTVADVGHVFLQFVLPAIAAAGFVLGFTFVLRHMSLDVSRRTPLYPTGLARRAFLVLAAGALVAVMILPWMLWLGYVSLYGLASLLVWPFVGAGMFERAPKEPLRFWACFVPMARKTRELMGGVGNVRLLRHSQLPRYNKARTAPYVPPIRGLAGPSRAHLCGRKDRVNKWQCKRWRYGLVAVDGNRKPFGGRTVNPLKSQGTN